LFDLKVDIIRLRLRNKNYVQSEGGGRHPGLFRFIKKGKVGESSGRDPRTKRFLIHETRGGDIQFEQKVVWGLMRGGPGKHEGEEEFLGNWGHYQGALTTRGQRSWYTCRVGIKGVTVFLSGAR